MVRTTVLSFLDDFAARGTNTALAHRRSLRMVRWSYSRVAATAFQFARELERRGIEKDDRVLLWAENCSEWVAVFWGCLLRGVIVVPLDAQSETAFVRRIQQQVMAKLALYSCDTREQFDLNIPALNLEEISLIIAPHSSAPYTAKDICEHDTVEIVFTSGTTAEPRGVPLSHRNLLANLVPLEEEIQKYLRWERLVHPIRFLNLLPLSHVFGQFMGIFVPQLLGGEVFFQDSLNPSEVINFIKRQRINVLVAVPRLLDSLREKVEADYESRGHLDKFRQALASAGGWHFLKRWWAFRELHQRFGWKFWAFISGGATLNPDTEQFWQRLSFAVIQGYGMTETASLISVNHPFKMSRGSIGKVLPGHEVKLDENGEILVRGANVTAGYWNVKAGTKENDDGWFRTGDVGEMDQHGNLYFRGRKKEVIVTAAGMNVYPEDIEAALNHQPEVRASAVIGVDGPRGPEPVAVLILRDSHADPSALVQRANQRLGQYQQVRRWCVWPEADFPRTPTQKVRKQIVAEYLKAGMTDEPRNTNRSGKLAEVITRVGGAAPARLDHNANLTTDLKLDSLGRVELLSALEDQYQIEIEDSAVTNATTLGDIEKIIQQGTAESLSAYPDTIWAQRFPLTWIRPALYYLIIWPITLLLSWTRVSGCEHLREIDEPVLFVANHITMTDHALILSSLPLRLRHRLAIAMDGEILRDFRYPPAGTAWPKRLRLLVQYALVVTFFNVFPLPQKSGFRRSFRFAGETMDRGHNILVFPEGRRAEEGRMNPFMAGIGLLVQQLDAPVVPVRIDGLYELKRQGKRFAWPGQVCVRFGAPVKYGPRDEATAITQDLQRKVAEL